MKWPWVSRGRLDDALSQIEWLREELASQRDGSHRIERVKLGLTEVPGKVRAQTEPMPMELVTYIKSHSNASLQRQARREAFRRYREGSSWDDIIKHVTTPRPKELTLKAADMPEEEDYE